MICTLKGFRQPQYDSIAPPERVPDNEKMTSCRSNDSSRAKDGPKMRSPDQQIRALGRRFRLEMSLLQWR
jgi:hypothetical protein